MYPGWTENGTFHRKSIASKYMLAPPHQHFRGTRKRLQAHMGVVENTSMKDAWGRWRFVSPFLQTNQWLHLHDKHPGQRRISNWTWRIWNSNKWLIGSFILSNTFCFRVSPWEDETFKGTNLHTCGWVVESWGWRCVTLNEISSLSGCSEDLWNHSFAHPIHPTQSCKPPRSG